MSLKALSSGQAKIHFTAGVLAETLDNDESGVRCSKVQAESLVNFVQGLRTALPLSNVLRDKAIQCRRICCALVVKPLDPDG